MSTSHLFECVQLLVVFGYVCRQEFDGGGGIIILFVVGDAFMDMKRNWNVVRPDGWHDDAGLYLDEVLS